MKTVIELASFKLREGVVEDNFLNVSIDFSEQFLATQKGLISRKLVKEGNIWSDVAEWEDMECAKKVSENMNSSKYALNYLSLIDFATITVHHMEVIQ